MRRLLPIGFWGLYWDLGDIALALLRSYLGPRVKGTPLLEIVKVINLLLQSLGMRYTPPWAFGILIPEVLRNTPMVTWRNTSPYSLWACLRQWRSIGVPQVLTGLPGLPLPLNGGVWDRLHALACFNRRTSRHVRVVKPLKPVFRRCRSTAVYPLSQPCCYVRESIACRLSSFASLNTSGRARFQLRVIPCVKRWSRNV